MGHANHISQKGKTMTDETCTLLVSGSSGASYSVCIRHALGKTSISCTCQAGQKMIMCKHRQAIIDGDESVLVGQQTENWALARSIIDASAIKASSEQLELNVQDNLDQQKQLLKKIEPEIRRLKAEYSERETQILDKLEPEMEELKTEHKQLKKIFASMLERGI